MSSSYSLLQDLQEAFPDLRLQTYFKASLTALSHAMEDMVLGGAEQALVIASFHPGEFYHQEQRRYQQIAHKTDQVYVMATDSLKFATFDTSLVTVPLGESDRLAQEWHLIILAQNYSSSIVCQEYASPRTAQALDSMRQFRGVWSFDRQFCTAAAKRILDHILVTHPEYKERICLTQKRYDLANSLTQQHKSDRVLEIDAKLFTERLVTYLQASQYKQLKAYQRISIQEQQERLINSITTAIRCSLHPHEILEIAMAELGKAFSHCRCLIYRFPQTDGNLTVTHEYVSEQLPALKGTTWSIAKHPLFEHQLKQNKTIALSDVYQDSGIRLYPELQNELHQWKIGAFLLIPIRYQEFYLGLLEVHQPSAHLWTQHEIEFLEAIATQSGVALLQGQSFENLETMNRQLMDLERTQRNLSAIVGHELRTPLSAIQICLETIRYSSSSLLEYHQEMLDIALTSSERLRQLIQDFLLLSQLESGTRQWQIEPISTREYVNLVISKFRTQLSSNPSITLVQKLPENLPIIEVDGEAFIEVLSKLIDNALKFTEQGTITIHTQPLDSVKQGQTDLTEVDLSASMLQITVSDTGCGIEKKQLDQIFERFVQEEEFMKRRVGGTGLGLSICRQIIQAMGGQIWATSEGKNLGSQFHFTVPMYQAIAHEA